MRKLTTEYGKDKYKIFFIDNEKEAVGILEKMEAKYKSFGFDIETAKRPKYVAHKKSGLCPHLSHVRLMQFYGGDDKIFVFDVWHMDLKMFKGVLSKQLIAHNAVFEMKFLKHFGVPIPHTKCTQVMADLIYRCEKLETNTSPRILLSLGDVSYDKLKFNIQKELQTSNWNAATLSIEQVQYAALDAVLTFRLMQEFLPKIKSFKLKRAFKMTSQLQNAIVDMELNGLKFDEKTHHKLMAQWREELKLVEAECIKSFGNINVGSSSQLNTWARETLPESEIKKFKETATGKLSFNSKGLAALKHLPQIQLYCRYKEVQGRLTKFGENLSRHIHPATGNIHASFWITGQSTGRMSSSNPNLQQIPRDDNFRKLFICEEDELLVGADFSQIETRVQAECSQDPVMLEAYKNGDDVYKVLSAKIFSCTQDKVTKEQRQIGKACILGLGYGMGAKKFRQTIYESSGVKLPLEEVQGYWQAYHETFEVYSKWCDSIRDLCTKTTFAKTVLGRKRKISDDGVYTKAPNTVIQGTAAQILYCSIIHLYDKNLEGLKLRAPIHDEIIVSAPKDKAQEYAKELEDSMVQGYMKIFPDGQINNLVDAAVGKSWGGIH